MVAFFEKFFAGRIIGGKGWHTVLREVITMENRNNTSSSNKKQQNTENKKQQSGESKKNNDTPENKNPTSKGY